MKNNQSIKEIVLIPKKLSSKTCIGNNKILWMPCNRRMSKICTCNNYPCCRWLRKIWTWRTTTLWWLVGQPVPHTATWFWIRPINQILTIPKWDLKTAQSNKRFKASFKNSQIIRRLSLLKNWGSKLWILTKSCKLNMCGRPKCWDRIINLNKNASSNQTSSRNSW